MPLSAVLRRRAHALIIFVGSALKPSAHVQAPASSTEPPGGRAISNLVSALIALATLQGGPNTENGMDDISQAARASLNQALGVMSAVDFISAVLSMVESGDQVVGGVTISQSKRFIFCVGTKGCARSPQRSPSERLR